MIKIIKTEDYYSTHCMLYNVWFEDYSQNLAKTVTRKVTFEIDNLNPFDIEKEKLYINEFIEKHGNSFVYMNPIDDPFYKELKVEILKNTELY